MALMVYAKYGRNGVYQMQDLLRRIHVNEEDVQKKVDNTKILLNTLPEGNWFNFHSGIWASEIKTDIGIYDLLLHSQDRAYSVPELYDYVEKSGLRVQKLLNLDNGLGDMLFHPETFIRDQSILNEVKKLSFQEQAAICELMFGQLIRQSCYLSFSEKKVPVVNDLELIPSIALNKLVTFCHKRNIKVIADCTEWAFIENKKSIKRKDILMLIKFRLDKGVGKFVRACLKIVQHNYKTLINNHVKQFFKQILIFLHY